MNICRLYDLSSKTVSYEHVWRIQKLLVETLHLSKNSPLELSDALVITQHPSTYTLGKGASIENIKFRSNNESEIFRIERGGEVTWHGPGQLVLYPILDLHRHKKDLRWYMRSLEQVVINTLHKLHEVGERNEVNAGVWIKNQKIAAVGVTASRWITMHGLAFNICNDMSKFDSIVPCGISKPGYGVCKLDQFIPGITFQEVKPLLLESFREVFQLDMEPHDVAGLDAEMSQFPSILNSTAVRL